MDLHWLGVVHAVGLTVALWLLMKGWRESTGHSSLFLAPVSALMFCDIGYVAYFNALYSESASLIFELSTAGFGLTLCAPDGARPRILDGFFLSALLLSDGHTSWRFAIVTCSALLMGAARGYQYLSNPAAMSRANLYPSVFYGILKDSPTPQADLRALGLSEVLAVLGDTHIFMKEFPGDISGGNLQRALFARVSHLDIMKFYLTHPQRLWAKLSVAAQSAQIPRVDYPGNLEKNAGVPARAKARGWQLWSDFKSAVLPRSPWLVPGCCAAWMILLGRFGTGRGGSSGRPSTAFYWTLMGKMLIALVTPVLADGEAGIEKHLFLFNALFDLSRSPGRHCARRQFRKAMVRAGTGWGRLVDSPRVPTCAGAATISRGAVSMEPRPFWAMWGLSRSGSTARRSSGWVARSRGQRCVSWDPSLSGSRAACRETLPSIRVAAMSRPCAPARRSFDGFDSVQADSPDAGGGPDQVSPQNRQLTASQRV